MGDVVGVGKGLFEPKPRSFLSLFGKATLNMMNTNMAISDKPTKYIYSRDLLKYNRQPGNDSTINHLSIFVHKSIGRPKTGYTVFHAYGNIQYNIYTKGKSMLIS